MLTGVRYVPNLKKNLISTGQLDDQGYHTVFGDSKWKLLKGARIILRGQKLNTLYTLFVSGCKSHVVTITELPKISLWHSRLGHMSV
eukprot:c19499_g1_i1 orf=449-709(+)